MLPNSAAAGRSRGQETAPVVKPSVSEAGDQVQYRQSRWDGTYMVQPVGPAKRGLLSPKTVKVDSLRPTLRWRSFPQSGDIEKDPVGILSDLRDVVYDLEIYGRSSFKSGTGAGAGDVVSEVLYWRYDLHGTEHRIEKSLEPCTDYFWTVRARFPIGRYLRATEWMQYAVYAFGPRAWRQHYHAMSSNSPSVCPSLGEDDYYRFKTPCDKAKPVFDDD